METYQSKDVENKFMVEDSAEESLLDSEDEFRKSIDGSDIDLENNAPRFLAFNYVEKFDLTFELGMVFSNKKELREAIHSYAIKNKRSINITKNDKIRVYAKCAGEKCEWKLHSLKLEGEYTYQIRKSDPKRNVKGFRIDVMRDIKCKVSKSQAYRAKARANELVEGQAAEQYALIWDFANEVKRSNPGSTIVIGTDDSTGDNRFDRLYMCLYAMKVGFLSGCRPFIGVDGCHLKVPHGGMLLSAVGVDPNNNNFPIVIAIVNNESGETWGWFLSLLKLDLNIEKENEWTFMSDKQKGLIQAFNEVFPRAEHKYCARHLHGNFKTAGFRGEAFKNAL
ncbi:uncharacterized protein [Henckelia pumila]|uniref:uncharacterized protein n=1 Tax=Henckelia pumila TaxID=405737 RepID=UPI003C6E584B